MCWGIPSVSPIYFVLTMTGSTMTSTGMMMKLCSTCTVQVTIIASPW